MLVGTGKLSFPRRLWYEPFQLVLLSRRRRPHCAGSHVPIQTLIFPITNQLFPFRPSRPKGFSNNGLILWILLLMLIAVEPLLGYIQHLSTRTLLLLSSWQFRPTATPTDYVVFGSGNK